MNLVIDGFLDNANLNRKMNGPLVSIITPVYNAVQFLDETLTSVLAQSYSNWELILVDDASTDQSFTQIQCWAKKEPRIKVLQQLENLGVAAARNAALQTAAGKYIAFLDSDDCWDQHKLEIQVNFMESQKVALSHTAYRKIDSRGKVITAKIKVDQHVNYVQLLKHNQIGFLTAMYNQEQIGKVFFKPIGHEDFAFWLHILKSGQMSYGIDSVLASYRVHPNSISHHKLKAASFTWTIYRQVEKLSHLRSLYYFIHYAFRAGFKFLKR